MPKLSIKSEDNCIVCTENNIEERLFKDIKIKTGSTVLTRGKDFNGKKIFYWTYKNALEYENKNAAVVVGPVRGDVIIYSPDGISKTDIYKAPSPVKSWANLAQQLPKELELSETVKQRRNEEAARRAIEDEYIKRRYNVLVEESDISDEDEV